MKAHIYIWLPDYVDFKTWDGKIVKIEIQENNYQWKYTNSWLGSYLGTHGGMDIKIYRRKSEIVI